MMRNSVQPATEPPLPPASGKSAPELAPVTRQAGRYLQASIAGTLVNFISRFPLTELIGFETSVIVANYLGMGIVFWLSYRRAFGIDHPTAGMGLRFVLVAHVSLVTVWLVATLSLALARALLPNLFALTGAGLPEAWMWLVPWVPRLLEGVCHGLGIVAGFFVNFFGHREYSFRLTQDGTQPGDGGRFPARLFAVLIPLAYVVLYAPMGMDTTDFGFFYGHPWRVLLGEVPFRDFYYTKPPASLYWHGLWMWLTPAPFTVLAGKVGFLAEMLAASWFGALFLQRAFDLQKAGLPLSLLATTGFVYGVHSFPAMPWHTADGVLAGAACLYAASVRKGALWWLSALLGVVVVLTKQSFLFVPIAALAVMLEYPLRRKAGFVAVFGLGMAAFVLVMKQYGAWDAFRTMTTGGLTIREAFEAGIGVYLSQNWWLPGGICGLWLAALALRKAEGNTDSAWVATLRAPFEMPLYFCVLTLWYGYTVFTTRQWIGYGTSWPTLFVLLGGLCVLVPGYFLQPLAYTRLFSGNWRQRPRPSIVLGAALVLAWSAGISGGYKIPAFFSVPLLFSAALVHVKFGGRPASLVWTALICGLVMFRIGYEHPYVFPERPMPRASLTFHAGEVFPALQGVLVDAEMQGILRDLKALRAKYGPRYKTLPGFPLAYLLTGDTPALPAEWLQDWEIANDVDKVYQMLVDRRIIVFFEKTQLDTLSPDGYARTRYSVPHRVRTNWQQIDETEHFVVFIAPEPESER